MKFDQKINVNSLPEAEDFGPLPAGWYDASITKSELKPTKDGNGRFLALELTVLGPKFQNRKLFTNVNVNNKNSAEAERIGQQQLRKIMVAGNLTELADDSQLVGVRVSARTTIKHDKEYGDKNEVKDFRAIENDSYVSTPVAQPTSAPSAAPWKR